MRAKNEFKFIAEAYNTKLLLERVVDGTLMCPEACCGAPVMECSCGPDCPHCNCFMIQEAVKKNGLEDKRLKIPEEDNEATSASFGRKNKKGYDGPWKNPRRERPDSGDAAMEFDRRGFAKNTKAGKEDEEDSITIGDIIDQVELDLPLTPDLADALQNVMDAVYSKR